MRRAVRWLLIIIALAALGWSAWLAVNWSPSPEKLGLLDGDIILQQKFDPQSAAISTATNSPYTHVGIVHIKDGEYRVLDAATFGVRDHAFRAWLAFGAGGKFTVLRVPGLTDEQRKAAVAEAFRYEGKKYDYQFSFDNDDIYCSELPYLAYKANGVNVGRVQQLQELNVDNMPVESLIRLRWKQSPYCQEKGMEYDACRARVMQQKMVTPASLAEDKSLTQIYSNF